MASTICAIIPTYNRAAMLRECLNSVLAQSRKVDQVIVVNDGSTDDTDQVVKSYGDKITLFTKSNGGKSSAINFALPRCKADYVWICDDDDIAAPDGLEQLAAALDTDAGAGFAYGSFKIFSDNTSHYLFTPPTYWARAAEPNPRINFFEEMFTFQFAMLVRASLYRETGPFREDLHRSEDYEMALRLSRHAKAIYVPKVIFYQRKHDGVRGTRADEFAAGRNVEKWLRYDQKIFQKMRKGYELEEFTPTFALNKPLAQRAAYVQRGCVFAQRALWSEAIEDFRAATVLDAGPATPEELQLAEAVIRNPLAWKALADNTDWKNGLRAVYQANEYGRQLIFSICRPLLWNARGMLKSANIPGATSMLSTLVSITGMHGAISRVLASLRN